MNRHQLLNEADDADYPEDAPAHSCFGKYFRLINKARYGVLLFWLIIFIVALIYGGRLKDHTSIEVTAPSNTDAYKASHFYTDNFASSDVGQDPFLIECRDKKNCTIVNDDVWHFINQTEAVFLEVQEKYGKEWFPQMIDYWTYRGDPGLKEIANTVLNTKHPDTATAMTAAITVKKGLVGKHREDYVKKIRDVLDHANPDSKKYYTGFASLSAVAYDSTVETAREATLIDAICLPLAMLCLMYFVRSWRMVPIPLFCIALTLFTANSIMLGFALVWVEPPSFIPSVLECFSVAMNIDYSLFLLTRFWQEKQRRKENGELATHLEAVCRSIRYAGHVVLMSGATLFLCSLGLILFKSDFIRLTGLAMAVTLFIAVFVNLTLTPALLLTFPNFFVFQLLPFMKIDDPNEIDQDTQESFNEENEFTGKTRWFEFTEKISTYPCNIMTLVGILAVTIPIGCQTIRIKQTSSLFQITPRGADSTEALSHLKGSFPPGIISPYYILVESMDESEDLLSSPDYLGALDTIRLRLQYRCNIPQDNILSLVTICTSKFNLTDPNEFPTCIKALRTSLAIEEYGYLMELYMSKNNRSSALTVTTPYDPTTDAGIDFVSEVRDKVLTDDLPSQYNYYFTNMQVTSKDAADSTFDAFPKNVAITFVIVCVVVSLGFQTAFLTIRYVLTLMIPISFIFGLAVLVYQDNILGWLSWDNVAASNGPMFWFAPVLTFFVGMGLALDYDIFLFLRIMEYRHEGYDNKMAIMKAADETANIITAAGMIMAVVFAGLLVGKTPVLIELGWILFSSVLFDTFVTRTIMVPVTVSLMGDWSWYPDKPAVTKGLGNTSTNGSPHVQKANI